MSARYAKVGILTIGGNPADPIRKTTINRIHMGKYGSHARHTTVKIQRVDPAIPITVLVFRP